MVGKRSCAHHQAMSVCLSWAVASRYANPSHKLAVPEAAAAEAARRSCSTCQAAQESLQRTS